MLHSPNSGASNGRRAVWNALALVMLILTSQAAVQPAPATEPAESRFSRQPEAEITFQQGLLHYNRGELQQAEKEFRDVMQADPSDAEAQYHLGLAQLDQGKAIEAIANFDRSLQLDPSRTEVRAARAAANIRLAQYDAAETDLKQLEPLPAWNGFVHYLRGQLYYAKGELNEAAKEFAEARRVGGTEAAPASLYEGLTYLRMRDLVQARSVFREATLGADRDPTVAAASRQLDAVLAAQQRRDKRWEVQITVGTEWDSNVILLGSNIPPPEGISDESDFRFLLQPRGSYSLIRSGKIDAGVEASGYFTWHQDLDEFDIQSYQGGPFINYRLSRNVYGSLRYGYNYIAVGRDEFLSRHLLTPQLTVIEPEFGYTSAYYQFQSRDFADDPVVIDPDSAESVANARRQQRDGQNHIIGIVQGINLPQILPNAGDANLELSYRFESQQTDGSDYDGNFHTVGATLYTPLPFWKIRADVGALVTFEDYTNGNTADEDRDERRDTEYGVTAGLTREIFQNCAVRVDYSYSERESNIDNVNLQPFDYDRHIVGVRMIFSY